jgi:hypothetical protein
MDNKPATGAPIINIKWFKDISVLEIKNLLPDNSDTSAPIPIIQIESVLHNRA